MPVLEYFNIKRGKNADKETPQSPILNDEDEKFLSKIASEEQPPPLPERPIVILDNGERKEGKDAQKALMDGADGLPLPDSPAAEGEHKEGNAYWSYIRDKAAVVQSQVPHLPFSKGKAKENAGADLSSAAALVKSGEGIEPSEAKKEEDELTSILDQLNLSAVNNRAFSFSKESTKLMEEFTLILKDIVNGVPTAYDDLEKLLTKQESQLTKMFGAMPPFLQTLVKSLPAKMTASLGPEFLAAMSEKPGNDAKMGAQSSGSAGKPKEKKSRIPSVKSLVTQQGLVASMLRSILNFLKLRFPVLMTGTNILMSLAVFILLFVFWYCHKRGKETRLAKEGQSAEASDSELEESTADIESPITLGKDPSVEEKPSTAVQDLESILNQPQPAEVPLPASEVERELATPVGMKK